MGTEQIWISECDAAEVDNGGGCRVAVTNDTHTLDRAALASGHAQLAAAAALYDSYRADPLAAAEAGAAAAAAAAAARAAACGEEEEEEECVVEFEVCASLEGDPCLDDEGGLLTEHLEGAAALAGEWVAGLLGMAGEVARTEDAVRTTHEREEHASRAYLSDTYFRHTIDKAIAGEAVQVRRHLTEDGGGGGGGSVGRGIDELLAAHESLLHLLSLYDVKRRLVRRDRAEATPGTVRARDLGRQRAGVVRRTMAVVADTVAVGEELALDLSRRAELVARHRGLEEARCYVADGTLDHVAYAAARAAEKALRREAEDTAFRLHDVRKAEREVLRGWAAVWEEEEEEEDEGGGGGGLRNGMEGCRTLEADARALGLKRHREKTEKFDARVRQQVKAGRITEKHHFFLDG